jgi:hypothetical protein
MQFSAEDEIHVISHSLLVFQALFRRLGVTVGDR